MRVLCHLVAGGVEEEATLDPTCRVDRLVAGSWMVMVAMVGPGGVLEGTSSSLMGG